MNDYNYRMDENDDPLIEDCNKLMFANYYSSKQSVNAFDALMRNKEGIQDAFIAYWDRTSARFAKNPYVVGFDPLNEPLAGNMYKYPENQIPGYTDKEFLAPMYEKIYAKYKANDEDALMWFEPVVHPDITAEEPANVFPVGFVSPPGGEIGSNKHILNDHTYCCQLNSTICSSGEPDQTRADDCYDWHHLRISTRDEDAKRLGVPLMISEFGACLTEGPCKMEIDQVGKVTDEYLVGWAYWQFKYYEDLTTSASSGSIGGEGFYNGDGSLQEYKVKALARSYMQYTQGVLTKQAFDVDTAEFNVEFKAKTNIQAPSVAYLSSEYYYQDGFDFKVTDEAGEALDDSAY